MHSLKLAALALLPVLCTAQSEVPYPDVPFIRFHLEGGWIQTWPGENGKEENAHVLLRQQGEFVDIIRLDQYDNERFTAAHAVYDSASMMHQKVLFVENGERTYRDSEPIIIDSPDEMHVGTRYRFDRGLPPDFDDIACEDGNPYRTKGPAAYMRGDRMMAAKKTAQAVCWLRISVKQDWPMAQAAMGAVTYLGALGVPQDKALAFELFRKSAETGIYFSQAMLAKCYRLGEGTAADPEKAAYWDGKARAQKAIMDSRKYRDQLAGMLMLGAAVFGGSGSAGGGPDGASFADCMAVNEAGGSSRACVAH